ncbi:hypothetical protein ACWT_6298 [Actinoplanes sp. SE50]|uniref:hypothetical protein n=1 Tax=unclassified Actinoplanes TaxID=2626549 RepID=UPI00023ED4D4|nr:MULTISPECIES: hypothetical protein [unclassified Actinoplanes]AEV87313.1 hypothetical protein ACPL_6431 [Actinoplanes sp. SE50/110]ATO85713.1 hypothetical protein ACWT_6298 [Actinoplanes sp. SE50]SLM03126.1 hypothetical protein ACSP50_6415 [Actinoplanes sp. SE50/110]
MNADDIADKLQFEWSADGGFLYGLRYGHFDPLAAERFLSVLNSVDPEDPARFEPRVVGRLWLIPYYMLSHLHNSERQGLDISEQQRVMFRANDVLAVIFGGRGGTSASSGGAEQAVS